MREEDALDTVAALVQNGIMSMSDAADLPLVFIDEIVGRMKVKK